MIPVKKIQKDNPWVCIDCGNQYLEENKLPKADSTAHTDTCCVCKDVKTVVHIRNYRWLYNWKNEKV